MNLFRKRARPAPAGSLPPDGSVAPCGTRSITRFEWLIWLAVTVMALLLTMLSISSAARSTTIKKSNPAPALASPVPALLSDSAAADCPARLDARLLDPLLRQHRGSAAETKNDNAKENTEVEGVPCPAVLKNFPPVPAAPRPAPASVPLI